MTGAAWTPELDEQLRELVATGYTSQEIAAATNRTIPAIKSRRGEIRALSGYHWRSMRRAIPPQPIDVRIRQLCRTIDATDQAAAALLSAYRSGLRQLLRQKHGVLTRASGTTSLSEAYSAVVEQV